MSGAFYPTLPGLTFRNLKMPRFNTLIEPGDSGRERRVPMATRQQRRWRLMYDHIALTAPGLHQLAAFYVARRASWDNFFYRDPTDNAVTAMPFGVGDGVKGSFPLTRQVPAAGGNTIETVFVTGLSGGHIGPDPTPAIYLNGVYIVPFTITDVGVGGSAVVNFYGPPGPGAILTWTGNFHFRVRFSQTGGSPLGSDQLLTRWFLKNFWDARQVLIEEDL